MRVSTEGSIVAFLATETGETMMKISMRARRGWMAVVVVAGLTAACVPDQPIPPKQAPRFAPEVLFAAVYTNSGAAAPYVADESLVVVDDVFVGAADAALAELEASVPAQLDDWGVEMQSGDPVRVKTAFASLLPTIAKHLPGGPVNGDPAGTGTGVVVTDVLADLGVTAGGVILWNQFVTALLSNSAVSAEDQIKLDSWFVAMAKSLFHRDPFTGREVMEGLMFGQGPAAKHIPGYQNVAVDVPELKELSGVLDNIEKLNPGASEKVARMVQSGNIATVRAGLDTVQSLILKSLNITTPPSDTNKCVVLLAGFIVVAAAVAVGVGAATLALVADAAVVNWNWFWTAKGLSSDDQLKTDKWVSDLTVAMAS